MGRPVVLVTAAALLPITATAIAARIDGSPRADFLRGGPSADRIDGRGGSADYVLPGIGVDMSRTGRIAVVYYVLRGGLLDVGFTSSPNGGRNWRPARRLNAQTMRLEWAAQAGGAMLGDYVSTSWSGGRAVSVFTLASPRDARFDQPLFAARLRR
jgi:hypothetical protein